MQASFRTAALMPWQQGVDCYFLQTHQHNLLLILLQSLGAAITEAAPATWGIICYLDCKNSGNKTNRTLYKQNVPSVWSPSISPPNKTSGGMHEILTPNYGAAFVYRARVRATNCMCGRGWGASGVPSSL